MTVFEKTASFIRGHERLERALAEMPVLSAIRHDYLGVAPLKGERIALCGHITEATAVQVRTLRDIGAEIAWCASSTSTTDEEIKAAMMREGPLVVGTKGMSEHDLRAGITQVCDHWSNGPTLVIDEGARLIRAYHQDRAMPASLRLATEKTPEGIAFAEGLSLDIPVLKSDDSLGKRLIDNPHGTSQSLLTTLVDVTRQLLAGKVFVVFGYGRVGVGLADKARGLGARVIVCETRPTRALMAALGGFEVAPSMEALSTADIVCTVTGRRGVIGDRHFGVLKDRCILMNGGHLPNEIDVEDLRCKSRETRLTADLTLHQFADGRSVQLVAEGRIANLTAGIGNPNGVMDVTFASQILALLHSRHSTLSPGLHDLPKATEATVARYVARSLGLDTTKLV